MNSSRLLLVGLLLAVGCESYDASLLPTLTSLTPAQGIASGGTLVTIAGTHLTSTTRVSFGAATSPTITVVSDEKITAVSPAGTGMVPLTVTTELGTSNAILFAYGTAPTLTSLTPTDGSASGGDVITLVGTGFTGATAVTFGSTVGTHIDVASDTKLTVQTPAGSGAVVVTVTTPFGTSNGIGFTYDPPPMLTSASPSFGTTKGGTPVVLIGTGLSDALAVSFGSQPVSSFSVISDDAISVLTPSGTGTVDVVVQTFEGPTNAVKFTYDAPGHSITSLSPTAGPTSGGTSVTLLGTGLDTVSSVAFGGTAGTSLTIDSSTSLTVVTPAHAAGTVDVVITTPDGSETAVQAFTFGAVPLPKLASLSPSLGPVAGGTTVTLTGDNLTTATGVTFGGQPATALAVVGNSITVATPAHAAGAVDVVVTTPAGSTTAVGAFTYVGTPTLSSVSPSVGAAGTTVTITGNNLDGTTSVTFGGVPGTSVTVLSSTLVTVVVPAHALGPVDVVVTAVGGMATLTKGFTYAPTITSVSPSTGSTLGGTTVTLTGTSFTGATSVTVGGVGVLFTVGSDSQITLTTPLHAAGAVDIVVTTPGGSVTATGAFTYGAAPLLVTVNPVTASAGAVITLGGTGFTGTTGVTFGGVAATNVTVVSPTSVTCVLPTHAAGIVAVTLTTLYGSSTLLLGFTYP